MFIYKMQLFSPEKKMWPLKFKFKKVRHVKFDVVKLDCDQRAGIASIPSVTEPLPYLQELRLRDGSVRVLTPSHHLLWEKVLEGKAERCSHIMRVKEGAGREERERRH